MTNEAHYDPTKLDRYDYADKSHPIYLKIRKMLWFCAGVDQDIMMKCPHSDRVKEEGIGGVILSTAVLAFISMSFAIFTVFGPKIGEELQGFDLVWTIFMSCGIGLIWSLIIFNLDRFIITATGHGDGTSEIQGFEFRQALPRIVMAIIIGACISAPLEIRVFKNEIDAALMGEQQKLADQRLRDKKPVHDAKLAELEGEAAQIKKSQTLASEDQDKLQKAVSDSNEKYNNEVIGANGGRTQGEGPVARALAASRQQSLSMLEASKPKMDALKADFADIETKIDAENARYDEIVKSDTQAASSVDGIGKRIELAHQLFPVSATLLMLMLMAVEVSPVIIKMQLIRGPYDYLTENQKEVTVARYAIEQVSSTSSKQDGGANGEIMARFHEAETILAYQSKKLAVEKELSDAIQDEFKNLSLQEIKSNPGKFVIDKPEGTV